MLRRYFATYDYTEIVMGEPREFVCETVIEAVDLNDAKLRANRYFEEIAFVSGVGWKRILNRWKIAEAPPEHELREPIPYIESGRSPTS